MYELQTDADTLPFDVDQSALAGLLDSRSAPVTETRVSFYYVEYPRGGCKPLRIGAYKRIATGETVLPFDADVLQIETACREARRTTKATHFEAWNQADGLWFAGAIF